MSVNSHMNNDRTLCREASNTNKNDIEFFCHYYKIYHMFYILMIWLVNGWAWCAINTSLT